MSEGAIDTLDAPRGAPDRRRMAAGAAQPPGPAVRGIIFDATDIVQDAVSWRRRLARLVHQLGVRASDADFYRRWDRDYLADVQRGRREFGEALESFLLAAGLSWAQIDEVEAASRLGRQSLASAVRPLPSFDKTLAQLCSMGVALAAWCDAPRPAAQLVESLARLALAQRFRCVLSSCDIDCVQPSHQCYRASLEALALPADEVLYVGHNPLHLAGAKAVGLATVAVSFQPLAGADAHLTRFDDLSGYVRSMAPGSPRWAA